LELIGIRAGYDLLFSLCLVPTVEILIIPPIRVYRTLVLPKPIWTKHLHNLFWIPHNKHLYNMILLPCHTSYNNRWKWWPLTLETIVGWLNNILKRGVTLQRTEGATSVRIMKGMWQQRMKDWENIWALQK
jgi:hypothetical protein